MADLLTTAKTQLDEFYDKIDSLPKLVGDLANSVAEGQRRMDQGYLENLAEFRKIVESFVERNPDQAGTFLNLFKEMGPTRQVMTETAMEVRVDLQMTTESSLGIGGNFGITVPFAVSINASYTKRTAYDFRAAAVVKTTINASPSSQAVMNMLLPRAGEPVTAELPTTNRGIAMLGAFEEVAGVLSPR